MKRSRQNSLIGLAQQSLTTRFSFAPHTATPSRRDKWLDLVNIKLTGTFISYVSFTKVSRNGTVHSLFGGFLLQTEVVRVRTEKGGSAKAGRPFSSYSTDVAAFGSIKSRPVRIYTVIIHVKGL